MGKRARHDGFDWRDVDNSIEIPARSDTTARVRFDWRDVDNLRAGCKAGCVPSSLNCCHSCSLASRLAAILPQRRYTLFGLPVVDCDNLPDNLPFGVERALIDVSQITVLIHRRTIEQNRYIRQRFRTVTVGCNNWRLTRRGGEPGTYHARFISRLTLDTAQEPDNT